MSATSRGIGGLAGLVLLDLAGGIERFFVVVRGAVDSPGGFKVDDGFVSME
ncbi:hypothetical protein WME76_22840 [Sorangium sp. So ce119]|uniref:hypothetical protein n=1 Tax=Sorangium sp. So ce119 TaxID=3133279 RepID=UPI003F5E3E0A